MAISLKEKTPTISSNATVCPIPLRYDTYSGCNFDCCYCFARPLIDHIRNVSHKPGFSTLVGSDPNYFEKWFTGTLTSDKVYTSASRIAIQKQIALKNREPF